MILCARIVYCTFWTVFFPVELEGIVPGTFGLNGLLTILAVAIRLFASESDEVIPPRPSNSLFIRAYAKYSTILKILEEE